MSGASLVMLFYFLFLVVSLLTYFMEKEGVHMRVWLGLCLFLLSTVGAANPLGDHQIKKVASVPGVIWGLTFLDSEHAFVTLRSGKIHIVNLVTGEVTPVKGAPAVRASGQGGLLDVALSPDKQWLYFTYSKPVKEGSATTLARAKLDKNQLMEWQDLLVTQSKNSSSRHYGSRITFDTKGHVYFGVGDRGDRDNGQNTLTHTATILRLNLNGSVPKDNPFVGDSKGLDEIYSYGHRNPQGLFYDRVTHQLWEIEHGPRGGDEINVIKAGANYGWPITSHGKEYWGPIKVGKAEEMEGIEPPVKVYVPSIAPGSLVLYRGTAFPELNGHLLAGALKLAHLNVIRLNDQLQAVEEYRLFEELKERIRDVDIAGNGWIYFSTDSGNIYRVSPK